MLVRGLGVASTWITLIAVMSLLVYHGFGVAGTRDTLVAMVRRQVLLVGQVV